MKRIGILGGGQLGRMLQAEAQQRNMPVYCMDKSPDAPAALYRDFYTVGDIKNYDDVMAFAQDKDVITIEIEHVNLEALHELQRNGKEVYPNPNALEIIKNKNKQKAFYRSIDIPIPEFSAFNNKNEALLVFEQWKNRLPCIYKSAEMGYDGKGVRTIHTIDDVITLDDVPGAFEQRIDIEIEIAVMIARSPKGNHVLYPPLAMYFDPANHILSEVHYPASIRKSVEEEMNGIALKVSETLDICGLCAFEFFVTTDGDVVLNEIAPRPHNSMHISMDNARCSQFEQHLRAIAGMPLGNTVMDKAGIMYNIIGQESDSGIVEWQGWDEVSSLDEVYVHLYGKSEIKPARKMGHINIVGNDETDIYDKLLIVKQKFKNINK